MSGAVTSREPEYTDFLLTQVKKTGFDRLWNTATAQGKASIGVEKEEFISIIRDSSYLTRCAIAILKASEGRPVSKRIMANVQELIGAVQHVKKAKNIAEVVLPSVTKATAKAPHSNDEYWFQLIKKLGVGFLVEKGNWSNNFRTVMKIWDTKKIADDIDGDHLKILQKKIVKVKEFTAAIKKALGEGVNSSSPENMQQNIELCTFLHGLTSHLWHATYNGGISALSAKIDERNFGAGALLRFLSSSVLGKYSPVTFEEKPATQEELELLSQLRDLETDLEEVRAACSAKKDFLTRMASFLQPANRRA